MKRMNELLLRATCLSPVGMVMVSLGVVSLSNTAYALPQDAKVVGGNLAITQTDKRIEVTQHTNKGAIDWRSFDIGANEEVRFKQPSANAATLNRVTGGGGASQINGQINANGRVVLINPNGMVFGQGAKVNVGGLLATTADIDPKSFMKGDNHFSKAGNPDAIVVNDGSITAKDAGLVGLVAPHVENHGQINAKMGRVTLAGGDTFAVDLYGDGLISLGVNEHSAKQLVRNTGSITAAGSDITITAAQGSKLVENLVEVQGELLAPSIQQHEGKITISGSNADVTLKHAKIDASGAQKAGSVLIGGDVQGSGTTPRARNTRVENTSVITANATHKGDGGKIIVWADGNTNYAGHSEAQGGVKGGNGGFVETSGKEKLDVTGQVITKARAKGYKAGTWLLDPRNVTITSATAGGTFSGGNPDIFTPNANSSTILNTTINNALDNGTTVIITTNDSDGNMTEVGDITLAADITKSSGSSDAGLILRAANSIISTGTQRIEVTGGTGKLNVKLNSDSDNSGAGAVSLTNTTVITNGGNFSAGGGNLASNGGVAANYDNAAIVLTDFAQGTNANDDGVYFSNADITTGVGSITLLGNAYNVSAAGIQQGVNLNSGSALAATSGSISITGTGGLGTSGGNNSGIMLNNPGTLLRTTTGNITLTGNGSTGNFNHNRGIDIFNGSAISSTGSGTITLNGQGGGSGSSAFNYGVLLSDSNFDASPLSAASITSNAGAITVNGTGGTGSGGVHVGVYLEGASNISATNNADINVTGIGGAQGNFNQGIYTDGNGWGTSSITTTNGNLILNGTTTQGGNSRGIILYNQSNVSSSGSGNMILTGNSTIGNDLEMSGAGAHTLGHASGTGSTTINVDDISLQPGSSIISNTGTITVKPRTNTTTIGIANGATGNLNLDTSELGYFSTNGLFEIGNRTNGIGAVDMQAWNWSGKNHHVLVAGGALNVNGAQTLAANKNLTLVSRNAQDITLSNDMSPAGGTGQVNLLSTQHIRANANVQHTGTGQVNAVAGWDGTNGLNADGSVTISSITGNSSYYGNNNGSVFINNAAGPQGVAVGSKDGATTVAGYDVNVTAPSDYDAQIGYSTAASNSPISVYARRNITLTGSSGGTAYTTAHIGHGRVGTNNNQSGDMLIRAGGNLSLTGGMIQGAVAKIGHGTLTSDGSHSGTIDVNVAGDVSVLAGNAPGASAAIGHGGDTGGSGSKTGDIAVTAGNVSVTASAPIYGFAQIGHVLVDSSGATASGKVTINADNLTQTGGGTNSSIAQIGHGGENTNNSAQGDINITLAQNLLLNGGSSGYAQIGHGVAGGSSDGTRQGNILVKTSGELSLVNSQWMIGHNTNTAGGLSNANIRIIANSLDFADDAVDPNDFNLNNVNFSNRMVTNLAGCDVTIASSNAPITLNSDIAYSSSHHFNLLSYGHIRANANIQNNGTGTVNLVSGWDNTHGLNANGSMNIATITGNNTYYGNNNGSIFINNAAGTQGVAVGSKDGATTVAGYAGSIIGSDVTNQRHAQIGYFDGTASGNINTYFLGDLLLHGREDYSVGKIGHGSYFSSTAYIGNITIEAANISLLSDSEGGSVAQIGHGHENQNYNTNTNISVKANGNLNVTGNGGTAIIGHGNYNSDGNKSGNITVEANNILLNGNTGSGHGAAEIGHGGGDSSGNISGNLNIISHGNLTLTGGNGVYDPAIIGHGFNSNFSGNVSGNILVSAAGELSLIDGANPAYIGHHTNTAGGLSNANIRIVANSLDFADDAVDPTSFNLNNINFRARMEANLAGGDVTIASTNAPIDINTNWNTTSASNRNLNILSYGNVTLYDNLADYGTGGHINLVAGWDGINGLNPANGSIDFSTLRLRDATDTGDLTLSSGTNVFVDSSVGTSIIAAAAGRFINGNGANGLSAASGRYVIYSTNHSITTLGSLAPSNVIGGYAAYQPATTPAGNYVVYDSNGNLTLLVGNQSYSYTGAPQLVASSGVAGYGTYYSLDAASLTTLTGAGYTLGNFTSSLTGNATFSVTGGDSTTVTTGRDIVGNVNTLLSSLNYDLSFNNTPTNELTIAAVTSPPPSGSGSPVSQIVPIPPSLTPNVIPEKPVVPTVPVAIKPPVTLAQPALPPAVLPVPTVTPFKLPNTYELISQTDVIKSPVITQLAQGNGPYNDIIQQKNRTVTTPNTSVKAQANIEVFSNGIITVDPILALELGLKKNEF